MAGPELSTNYIIKPGQSSNRAADAKRDLERGPNKINNNQKQPKNKNNPPKEENNKRIITTNNKNKKNKKNNKGIIRKIKIGKSLKPKVRPARKTAIKAEVLLGRKGSHQLHIKTTNFWRRKASHWPNWPLLIILLRNG